MKTLFVLASVMIVLFLAIPNKIEAQKRKAARVIEGTISGFECGDNCYLTITDNNGKEHTGLCNAPLCNSWVALQTMPNSYKGKRVKVTIDKGKRYTDAGAIVDTMDAFTSIQLLTAPSSQALPQFQIGTPYPKVRKMLMALGWQPVTLPTATPCGDDDRCRGFTEVYACSGVGRAACVYMWKKKTTLIRVFGVGENVGQVYDSLKPCPLHPTQFDPECGGREPDSAPTKSKPKIREVKQTINLTTEDGGSVVANDFIHNGVTVPDKNNPGEYILAEKKNFNISYNPTYQAFHIGLSDRPIGQARLDMEQFMLRTLGLTKNQLCRLTYFVMTTSYVSPKYGGVDLRFSFCPGATKLP